MDLTKIFIHILLPLFVAAFLVLVSFGIGMDKMGISTGGIDEEKLLFAESLDPRSWNCFDGDRENYFGATINKEALEVLRQAGFQTIIRLNGDTPSDQGFLSIEEESYHARTLGLDFYYFNIEGSAGINYDNAEMIAQILEQGRVFIHCRNGAHRAPAMAAYFLRTRTGLSRQDIIETVHWVDLVEDPGP